MNTEVQANQTPTPPPAVSFGARLQSAREALGLDSKDAASQLRLNERVILMMETDCYSSDLPATFVRGYIRAYGKLLQIPEDEIKLAIAPIKPQPSTQPAQPKTDDRPKVTSSHYFMQIFTYLVIFTLVSLVGAWWYTHNTAQPTITDNQIKLPSDNAANEESPSMTMKNEANLAEVALSAKANANAEAANTSDEDETSE